MNEQTKFVILVGLATMACAANAASSDPTPRTTMSARTAAKVHVSEAKQWRLPDASANSATERVVTTTPSGRTQSCTTSVGPAAAPSAGFAPTGSRMGAQRESTVIVTGDVINVCK